MRNKHGYFVVCMGTSWFARKAKATQWLKWCKRNGLPAVIKPAKRKLRV